MPRKVTYLQKNREKIIDPFTTLVYPKEINEKALQDYIEGKVLLINKPLHATSFDLIKHLRRILKIKKIGHAGTLDPLATGLVLLCTGKCTKQIDTLMKKDKIYTGEITLGAVTESFDLETEPYNFKSIEGVTIDAINTLTQKFIGEQYQVPPKYSAIKKDGVALYELARKGLDVEVKPRKIIIYELEINAAHLPILEFRLKCSSGTYIRSFAHEFGQALGCGAYLNKLHRSNIGEFDCNNAKTLQDIVDEIEVK